MTVSGWARAAHVFALSGLAVAQPVLGLLGDNPTFFVAHGSGPGAVLGSCLLVIVVVPAVLLGVEAVVGRVRPAWAWPTHLVVIGLLLALVVGGWLEEVLGVVLDDLSQVSGPLTVVGMVVGAVLLTRAYARRPLFRTMLGYLALAPLAFLALFAFASPGRDLLFPPEVAAEEVDLAARPPIVVVVLDELPLASVVTRDSEQIDAERFPNLARLAADGTWYRNATSVAAYTHEAVPAILTGQEVRDENLPPTVSGHPDTLFTLLADDYEVAAHEQLTDLCTPAICDRSTSDEPDTATGVLLQDLAVVAGHVALPALLDDWIPSVGDTWAGFGQGAVDLDQEADDLAQDREALVDELGDTDRVGELQEAIAGIQRGDEPRLTFVHTVFPHVPWTYLPDGTPYPDPGNAGLEENVWTTDAAGDRGLQRHLLQAEYADVLLGELLDRLEAIGTYDEVMVVVVADHGASFATGTHRREPADETVDGLMAVPLVVKYPDRPGGRVDDRPAQTVDVLPTIADVLGVEVPWDVDGHSLVGPAPEPGERTIRGSGLAATLDGPVDLQPIVDHLRDTFGDPLQLYALGPDLVGEPAAVDGEADACWEGESGPGWVEGSADVEGDVAVAVDGTIVGTAPVGDEGDVLVLGDPAGWTESSEVALLLVADDDRRTIPAC